MSAGKADFTKYAQVLAQVGVLEKDTDPLKLADLAVVPVTPEFTPEGAAPASQRVAQFPAHLVRELNAASPLVTCGPEHAHGHAHARAANPFYCDLT